MHRHHKLSLRSAILININVMLGAGIFINTAILAQKVGIFGGACYTLVGILMLPLMMAITKLLSMYPAGGFYTFGSKSIHPFVGFLSAWGYATGKLASCLVITQLAVLLLQQLIVPLAAINPLVLNASIMGIFICLNMFDIQTSSSIQSGFLILKIIPIAFAIISGLYLFFGTPLPPQTVTLSDISIALPLVLFAIAGFEVACSLSSRIENAHINGPRAIYISYAVVIATTTLFQFMIYAALATDFPSLGNYRLLFPALVSHLLPGAITAKIYLISFLHCAIAASALGGSYGIIFSNTWNIYTLAQHGHLLGAKQLVQLNRYHIPWLCVVLEGVIYLLFLVFSGGNQIPLQQMGALGSIIGYTISALSLLVLAYKKMELRSNFLTALLALGSCLLLMMGAIYGLLEFGPSSLVLFWLLLLIGSLMFWITRTQSTNLNRH